MRHTGFTASNSFGLEISLRHLDNSHGFMLETFKIVIDDLSGSDRMETDGTIVSNCIIVFPQLEKQES